VRRYMSSPDLSTSIWPKSVLKVIIIHVRIIQVPILHEDSEGDECSEKYKAGKEDNGHQDADDFNSYHIPFLYGGQASGR